MKKESTLTRAVTAMTAILCAALCAAAILLYAEGMARRQAAGSARLPIYTAEGVEAHLLGVLPAAAVWAALVMAAAWKEGWREPARAMQRPERTLALLYARLPALPPAAQKEQALRRRVRFLCGVGICLCALWALIWLMNRKHFVSWDLEAVMGRTMLWITPPAALAFGLGCLAASLCDASRLREAEALTEAIRTQRLPRAAAPLRGQEETKGRRRTRLALLLLAAVLIILGILNGGLNDVLVKAINICTECIGLG